MSIGADVPFFALRAAGAVGTSNGGCSLALQAAAGGVAGYWTVIPPPLAAPFLMSCTRLPRRPREVDQTPLLLLRGDSSRTPRVTYLDW